MRLRRRLGSPDWPLLQYLGLDNRSYNNLVSGFSLYNEERYEDLEANSRGHTLPSAELWSYLTANQTRLINYGREYHEGHRSTVRQNPRGSLR